MSEQQKEPIPPAKGKRKYKAEDIDESDDLKMAIMSAALAAAGDFAGSDALNARRRPS